MIFSDYHTALTVALAVLLLLSVIRLYQIRRDRVSADATGGGDSDADTEAVTELLMHEEIAPLLNDLARKVEAEFGFVWPEFTLESEDDKPERKAGDETVFSRLIRVDQNMAVRFRWSGSSDDSPTDSRLDSVERLTRAYVLNVRRIQHYKRLADRDPLTGLFNAAYLRLRLKEEIERSKRFRRSVGVFILDVDHFKQINDNLGHLTGDQALKFLATLVVENVRSIDIVCRYGGDELCIILPDASEATVRGTMSRLQDLIRSGSTEATGVALTVSIGGSLSVFGALSPEALFEEADRAMLSAKRQGRDQCFFKIPVDSSKSIQDIQERD
jgi:diguanylate cyclase (GGDEF)-like protein